MFRPDPLRYLYRFYSLVNRISRFLISPFGLVTSFIFYVRKIFLKNFRVENVGDWGPIRRTRHSFYWLASRPKKWFKSSLFRSAAKTYPVRAVRRVISLGFKTSFLEPFKWFVQLAGFAYSWVSSRKWAAITLSSIPAILIVFLLVLDFRATRIDKSELSKLYLELAEEELGTIEESFDFTEVIRNRLGESTENQRDYSRDPRTGFSRMQSSEGGVTGYGDLLFRRVQLLSPGEHSCLVVGLKLLETGADVEAQKMLSRVAPDDRVKDFRAHGVMATILLERIAATADESLFPVFQHHAAAGSRWRFIPPEVLAASAELHWLADEHDQAFELLNIAAEIRPEFFLLYHERAIEAGLLPLAESIRERAIARYERLLKQNPTDDALRANLSAIYCATQDGVLLAEKLLKEASVSKPSQVLSRALSEVYLKQLKLLIGSYSLQEPEIMRLVDVALAADASNPNLADFVAGLMRRQINSTGQSQLVSVLNNELAKGVATTGTHAMLSEYYLQNDQPMQAVLHLEQVYRIAPTAAKFCNNLAHEYARANRLQDALDVANRSLSALSDRNLLAERYVDDLLDTLGKIYHKQQNWPEAIPVYELCLKISPERAETRLRLARVYRKDGRDKEAVEQELLAKKSETMASRRKTLVQKLASPEMLMNQTLGIGGKEIDDSAFLDQQENSEAIGVGKNTGKVNPPPESNSGRL